MALLTHRRTVRILTISWSWALFTRPLSMVTVRRFPFPNWKWTPLPVGVGLLYIGYQQWCRAVPRNDNAHRAVWPTWKISIYRSLPLNALSRTFGWLADVPVPKWLRRPIFGLYCRLYCCRLDEAVRTDLQQYSTLSDFFGRDIKTHLRPISLSCLVSPVDGTVLQCGKVHNGKLEQVKGIDYDVHDFLGMPAIPTNDENCLYSCVIYLAPGDYHGFHSPTDWMTTNRRHFPGLLLSVSQPVLFGVPQLFSLNERVVLNGTWKYGFFTMTAVAATNVGDIVLSKDPSLHTNVKSSNEANKLLNSFLKPGEKVGDFRLGSSIVLVFEAPENLRFTTKTGDRLRYGQSLAIADDPARSIPTCQSK